MLKNAKTESGTSSRRSPPTPASRRSPRRSATRTRPSSPRASVARRSGWRSSSKEMQIRRAGESIPGEGDERRDRGGARRRSALSNGGSSLTAPAAEPLWPSESAARSVRSGGRLQRRGSHDRGGSLARPVSGRATKDSPGGPAGARGAREGTGLAGRDPRNRAARSPRRSGSTATSRRCSASCAWRSRAFRCCSLPAGGPVQPALRAGDRLPEDALPDHAAVHHGLEHLPDRADRAPPARVPPAGQGEHRHDGQPHRDRRTRPAGDRHDGRGAVRRPTSSTAPPPRSRRPAAWRSRSRAVWYAIPLRRLASGR